MKGKWILILVLLSIILLNNVTAINKTQYDTSNFAHLYYYYTDWGTTRDWKGDAIDSEFYTTPIMLTNWWDCVPDRKYIYRIFIGLNTSGNPIPSNATILNTSFYFNLTEILNLDNDGNDFVVMVGNTTQSSITTTAQSEYGNITNIEVSERYDISSWSLGRNSILLNTIGLNNLNKSGENRFALRMGHDLLNHSISPCGKYNQLQILGRVVATDRPLFEVNWIIDVTSPSITTTNQTIEYGSMFEYTPTATDVDGSGISKYKINDTTNFQINVDNGTITNKTGLNIGFYLINVSVNDTIGNINSSIFKVTVQDTTAPTWNQTPTNQEVNYPDAFSYQVNASDLSPLSTYYIDDTTNFTIDSTTGIIINNTLLIGNKIYGLNVSVNDTIGNILSQLINITVNDIANPQVYVIAPTGTYTSATGVPLTGNSSDNIKLDSCWYNITNDAGVLEKANTDLTNCVNISTTFSIGGGNDDYILYLYVNDTTGNINSSSHTFTINVAPVIPPAPSGGSGGSISVDKNYTFAIVVWNYFATESKQIGIKPAQVREYCLDLISTNTEESQEVELFCELPLDPIRPDICDWITFDRKKVTLQPTEEIREKVCLTITTPEDIVLGDQFLFSIMGKSDLEESQEFLHPITLWVTDYSQFIKNYGEILTSDTLMQSTYDFIKENIKDDITELGFTWSNFWFPLILFNQIILLIVFLTLTKNPITILISQISIYMTVGVASMFYAEVMIVVTLLSLITLIFVRLWKK